jgi:TonB family protein
MATARQRNRGRRLGFWLLLAALIHAEALLVIGVSLYFYAPRNADLTKGGEGQQIEISTLDDETARRILAELEREEEKAEEEKTKKEIEAQQPPGQVVDLAKPLEEKRPDNARFAAEYDSTVKKETRKYGRFDMKARQGDAAGEADQTRPASPASPPVQPSPPGTRTRGAMAMKTAGEARGRTQVQSPPPEPARAAVAGEDGPPQTQDPEGALAPGGKVEPRPRMATPSPGGQAGSPSQFAPNLPALVPSQQQVARAISSGTEDHLQDIDDGDETALNSKKWKFSVFFNRVKQQVREHWRPAEVYRRRDPTGAIYGSKDRYTLLRVQLKPDGSLANVVLETPSGVEFLDDEAIEAFKQAQPFPNPPPQLVESTSGMINFRFGFYFEISGSPKFKIFRYNSM